MNARALFRCAVPALLVLLPARAEAAAPILLSSDPGTPRAELSAALETFGTVLRLYRVDRPRDDRPLAFYLATFESTTAASSALCEMPAEGLTGYTLETVDPRILALDDRTDEVALRLKRELEIERERKGARAAADTAQGQLAQARQAAARLETQLATATSSGRPPAVLRALEAQLARARGDIARWQAAYDEASSRAEQLAGELAESRRITLRMILAEAAELAGDLASAAEKIPAHLEDLALTADEVSAFAQAFGQRDLSDSARAIGGAIRRSLKLSLADAQAARAIARRAARMRDTADVGAFFVSAANRAEGNRLFQASPVGRLLQQIHHAILTQAVNAGTVAAGAFGGPAAASAVSSLRGLPSIVCDRVQPCDGGGKLLDQLDTAALYQLQNALNTQSQTNNMITNMQKARHDAMMAAIQNTR